ncbi:MAG: hypothetical protein DBX52_01790 [Clostridiales bacterium]|nr:MAG: hypothetical protein DBX52_01790 [Clostridiales bacterium]
MIERNRMRHKKIILLLILLFLLLAGAATTGLFLQRHNRQNAAAKVGGSLITQEQVEAVWENQAFRLDWLRAEQAACSDPLMADRLNEEIQKRESYTREEALDTLIRKELIRQECAALGITVSEEEALRALRENEALLHEQQNSSDPETRAQAQKLIEEDTAYRNHFSLGDAEYEQRQSEGYRDLLLNQKLYAAFQERASDEDYEQYIAALFNKYHVTVY